MPGARQLLRARKPRSARADHRDLLAGPVRRRLRPYPAFFPGLVDDRVLDRLDTHCVGVDAQHAGFLARRRADAAGEFGEIVGGMQGLDRRLPVLAVNEVVPVRNDVVDRAARHAERDAAIHAARSLSRRRLVRQACIELAVVLLAGLFGLVRLREALVLHETGDLPHSTVPCIPTPRDTEAQRTQTSVFSAPLW